MYEGPDPVRIGEVWEMIRKGDIPCEKNLKNAVTGTILNYGSEKVGKSYEWTKREPIGLLQEIADDLLKIITEKKLHTGEEMTEAEVDFQKELRVRFIKIRRAVRNHIRELEDEE